MVLGLIFGKNVLGAAECPNYEILGNRPNDENEADMSASFHVWDLSDYFGNLSKTW